VSKFVFRARAPRSPGGKNLVEFRLRVVDVRDGRDANLEVAFAWLGFFSLTAAFAGCPFTSSLLNCARQDVEVGLRHAGRSGPGFAEFKDESALSDLLLRLVSHVRFARD